MPATLRTSVNGLDFPNPFLVGSGPPGDKTANIIRAFKAGWGGVVTKTMSLNSALVRNPQPRLAHLRQGGHYIGTENIELISDVSFEKWEIIMREVKDACPDGILIASIMEEPRQEAWAKIVHRCLQAGVDGFELNLSCGHGMPERGMGSAMGQHPDIIHNVCSWVRQETILPVWAKMTPNISDINVVARAALGAGCDVSAINTVRCLGSIDLKTMSPRPSVKGSSTFGGLSGPAIRWIANAKVAEIAQLIRTEFPDRTLSGIGGVQNFADAATFIMYGANTVQVCTEIMMRGYEFVGTEMIEGLLRFMEDKGYSTIEDFRGSQLDSVIGHSELVALYDSTKGGTRSASTADACGDIVSQSNAIA